MAATNSTMNEIDPEVAGKELKRMITKGMFHTATPANGNKIRGVGVTRKDKEETKKARKLAKLQRAKNHKMSNKKRKPTGSKKRK